MKLTTVLATLAVLALPVAAFAGPGCSGDKLEDTSASTCAPGLVYDTETETCVATTG
jgi:hypothetical protein